MYFTIPQKKFVSPRCCQTFSFAISLLFQRICPKFFLILIILEKLDFRTPTVSMIFFEVTTVCLLNVKILAFFLGIISIAKTSNNLRLREKLTESEMLPLQPTYDDHMIKQVLVPFNLHIIVYMPFKLYRIYSSENQYFSTEIFTLSNLQL